MNFIAILCTLKDMIRKVISWKTQKVPSLKTGNSTCDADKNYNKINELHLWKKNTDNFAGKASSFVVLKSHLRNLLQITSGNWQSYINCFFLYKWGAQVWGFLDAEIQKLIDSYLERRLFRESFQAITPLYSVLMCMKRNAPSAHMAFVRKIHWHL